MPDDKLDLLLSKLEAIEATKGQQGAAIEALAADQRKNLAATAAGFEGMNDRLDNLQSELGIVREEVKLARSEISQFRKEYSGGYRALKDEVTRIADRVGVLEKAQTLSHFPFSSVFQDYSSAQ